MTTVTKLMQAPATTGTLSEEDILAVQAAVHALRDIASGRTDYVKDEFAQRRSTIKDAIKKAEFVLPRLEAAYHRLTDML